MRPEQAAAAQLRAQGHRAVECEGGDHDPPPSGPRERDLGLPGGRPSSSRPPSGRRPPMAGSATATSSGSSTTASTTAWSTSSRTTPTRSPASHAPSTCSATAACGSSSRQATRRAHVRRPAARSTARCWWPGDAIFMRRTLDDDHLPHMHRRRAPLPALATGDQAVREGDPGRRRDPGARLGGLGEAPAGLLGGGEVKLVEAVM